MSVWYCIPSARPVAEAQRCVDAWRAQGYKVALWRDDERDGPLTDQDFAVKPDEMLYSREYPGYAAAVNSLAAHVFKIDPECQWIVTGGDDTLPDPDKRADEIAAECTSHFWTQAVRDGKQRTCEHFADTFGVMQPTGDRFARGSIDRIAGSPWMGRTWCQQANGGQGPFWPEFTHMFGDQCLKETAEALGVYWMRPDLCHLHRHFMRQSDDINSPAVRVAPPPHLVKWNSQAHWNEMEAIYKRLKAQGFAPCMPLPVAVTA